jgi:hypothetical protein
MSPPVLWGGNPAQFFVDAGLHARVGDAGDGTWLVKTQERHTRVSPGLVEVITCRGRFNVNRALIDLTLLPDRRCVVRPPLTSQRFGPTN